MATSGMNRAFVTPLELALFPPLYKSAITSEGSSITNGSVDTDAQRIGHPFIYRCG